MARTSVVRITKHYYHDGARVALRTTTLRGSVVQYLHSDHLGSVTLLTDYALRVTAQQRFLPYGGVRYTEGTFPTDVGFTGQRADGSTGLMYYRARYYYHPGLGRFVSADTIVPNPLDPQLFNRYSYARNNPILYNDPDGHCGPLCVAIVVGLVVGGAFLSGCSSPPPQHPAPAPPGSETRFYYSEQYGWFDRTHFNDHDILNKVRDAVSAGEGAFTLKDGQVGDLRLHKRYWVSGDITEDQIPGVALGIFMDFQDQWESLQGKYDRLAFTAYAVDDLPSNMLKFIASSQGKTTDELL